MFKTVRREARRAIIAGVLLALSSVSPPPDARAANGSPRTAGTAPPTQVTDYLGFELGVERRYTLGPRDALASAESVEWSIKLEEVDTRSRRPVGTFWLEHRRVPPAAVGEPEEGRMERAQVHARLHVNMRGTPLFMTSVSERWYRNFGKEWFNLVYQNRGNRFEKRVTMQMTGPRWVQDIGLIEHPSFRTYPLEGLFVFAPEAVYCLEWPGHLQPRGRTGTAEAPADATVDIVVRSERNYIQAAALGPEECYEGNTDPAFANPGLVSLIMPLLWERGGDAELVSFAPLRPDLVAQPGAMLAEPRGDRDRAVAPERYFSVRRMYLTERQRIDIGRRRIEALPLHVAGYPGAIWVDDDGQVVRMDIPPRQQGEAPLWIRLMHPNEYQR